MNLCWCRMPRWDRGISESLHIPILEGREFTPEDDESVQLYPPCIHGGEALPLQHDPPERGSGLGAALFTVVERGEEFSPYFS